MSRNKYSVKMKIEICERYLAGESATALANEYRLTKKGADIIREWSAIYKIHGIDALVTREQNSKYTKEFKKMVIEEYLQGKNSLSFLARKYNIRKNHTIRRWINLYNKSIELKDYDPKREVYAMKSRRTTPEERLEIVQYVIANNMDYKGTAEKYVVPYANVYAWTKKYIENGETGLRDNRGRPSSNRPERELSELEKKDIEIEKLKKQLEYEKLVNTVLKKNIEITQRLKRDSPSSVRRENIKQSKK